MPKEHKIKKCSRNNNPTNNQTVTSEFKKSSDAITNQIDFLNGLLEELDDTNSRNNNPTNNQTVTSEFKKSSDAITNQIDFLNGLLEELDDTNSRNNNPTNNQTVTSEFKKSSDAEEMIINPVKFLNKLGEKAKEARLEGLNPERVI